MTPPKSHVRPDHIAPAPTLDRNPLDRTIAKAIAWLDREQHDDGYWVGKLESNSIMEAEWLLAMHVLCYEHPRKADIAATLLASQRADGAWAVYLQAPGGDINSTVECYAALRSTGMAADAEPLARARGWIEANGGLRRIRVFTRYWLALIGEWPWEQTPNVLPEIIACPRWLPFNIYRLASWARVTLVPLTILSARRLVRPLPDGCRLDELFPDGRNQVDYRMPRDQPLFSSRRLFLVGDRVLHWCQSHGFTPGRNLAIKACIDWILRHQDADGTWGGIQPPWIYSLMALHTEGYPLNHPVLVKGLAALDGHWSYQRNGMLYIQISESPVWDTWLSLLAMRDCERGHTPAMERALGWLLDHEVTQRGDWARQNPQLQPGGWSFQRANRQYPDLDDTAVALCVLARLPLRQRNRPRIRGAIERALAWALGMQSSNGGWAAFDRDNDNLILTKVPFSDYGEVLDPPSADVTAHMVEALGQLGYSRDHPAVENAYRFLLDEQEPDGPWFGRWGVNYIYGTGAVIPALAAIGEDMNAAHVRRATDWLAARQNADGGWGEAVASYVDERQRGLGPSTASQTAWSLMALLATRSRDYDPGVRRGIDWLTGSQRGDGTWEEPQFTGTGFPGYLVGKRLAPSNGRSKQRIDQGAELRNGSILKYSLYCHYFPLMALGRARSHFRRDGGEHHGTAF